MLQHRSHIEAKFVSDWPSVIVQKCALRLLYQQDQVRFEQELKHCNDLIFEQKEIVRKHLEAYEKKGIEQSGVDERNFFSTSDVKYQLFPRLIDQSETNESKTQLRKSVLLVIHKLLIFALIQTQQNHLPFFLLFSSLSTIFSPNLQDYDQCYVYNYCFPLCEILEWFSHQSDDLRVTIPTPPNVYNDSTCMGLALCVSVAAEANLDALLDIHDSETSYNLIFHLETSIECGEPLHVYHISKCQKY